MESKELQELLISSCNQYFHYLAEKGSGRSEISVYEKNPTKTKGIWSLRLAERLFSLDAIVFEFPKTGEVYSSEQIKIVEYDFDNRVLLVKPLEKCKIDFTRLRSDEILIVSDLKFLIERLGNYYRTKGNRLKLPVQVPDQKFDADTFDYLPGCVPADSQKTALNTIFHSPLSYIWGAPGTGKTRFVLANALLKYIRANKRIGIFAPTNVALEQVLKGIIEFTDQAGIDRKNILRIGNPSRNFASQYPEVCEVSGVEKQMKEIKKQIEILKGILGIDDLAMDEISISNLENLIRGKTELSNKAENLSGQLQRSKIELKRVQERITHCETSISGKRAIVITYEQKRKSFWGKILHAVATKFDYESRISETLKEIEKLEEILTDQELQQEKLDARINTYNSNIINLNAKLKKTTTTIKSVSFHTEELNAIWDDKSHSELNRLGHLRSDIKTLKEKEEKSSMLEAEYSGFSKEVLTQKLNKYVDQLSFLEKQSTQERVKDVKVVGATLDAFVSRYEKEEVDFEHIFIDEAAYCNVAKSLVVFTLETPVTFLGDHLQLPPVTEMNITELKDENEICFPFLQSSLYSESFFFEPKQKLLANLKNNTKPEFRETKKADLKETYRFGENLAKVLDEYVYRNGFKGKSANGTTEILFIHADKTNGQKKRENPAEVRAIQNFVSTASMEDFVILTPYNFQVSLIGQMLPKERNEQRIMTVHKSQGREWDTVILSVSDTYDMWFTDSTNNQSNGLNLLNTAVSRAKKNLVIVCDINFWKYQRGQLISGLLSTGKELKIP